MIASGLRCCKAGLDTSYHGSQNLTRDSIRSPQRKDKRHTNPAHCRQLRLRRELEFTRDFGSGIHKAALESFLGGISAGEIKAARLDPGQQLANRPGFSGNYRKGNVRN